MDERADRVRGATTIVERLSHAPQLIRPQPTPPPTTLAARVHAAPLLVPASLDLARRGPRSRRARRLAGKDGVGLVLGAHGVLKDSVGTLDGPWGVLFVRRDAPQHLPAAALASFDSWPGREANTHARERADRSRHPSGAAVHPGAPERASAIRSARRRRRRPRGSPG